MASAFKSLFGGEKKVKKPKRPDEDAVEARRRIEALRERKMRRGRSYTRKVNDESPIATTARAVTGN